MLNYKTYIRNMSSQWIVMIHGAGGSIEVWYKQITDFARHFNLLLVDLAGHGNSPMERQKSHSFFDFEIAAEQVVEVVDYLKIEKAHFMGLSLGSIIVRVIADKHSERVCSMVLAGAVTELSMPANILLRLADMMKHIVPYRFTKWMFAKIIMPQRRYGQSMRLFLHNAQRLSFDNFQRWLKLGSDINNRIRSLFYEKLSIPTLYIMGEDDYLFLEKIEAAVRHGGKLAHAAIVPDAGHVCNVDNKRLFNRISLDFIQSVEKI